MSEAESARFALRVWMESGESLPKVTSPSEALTFFVPMLTRNGEQLEKECLAVIAIDQQSHVIDKTVLTQGTHRFTFVHPPQIARWLLTRSRPCRGCLIAHNHPSGNPLPSSEDKEITVRLQQALKLLDLSLLDHIIIGDRGRSTSLAEEGLLPADYSRPSFMVQE
jgi:DNA repair protein RadC